MSIDNAAEQACRIATERGHSSPGIILTYQHNADGAFSRWVGYFTGRGWPNVQADTPEKVLAGLIEQAKTR